MIKVYIVFELTESSTGGGNQFLKALKQELSKGGHYSENIGGADIILFNSYQYIEELLCIKENHPDKLYLHRVDGPIRLYNRLEDKRDSITNSVNNEIADATVFQSEWSKEKCLDNGLVKPLYSTVIMNAPDSCVFYASTLKLDSKKSKLKIISTSWSANMKKGFETYKWLDKNLDFELFDYVFVGNSPVSFNNITVKPPMCSSELADELRSSDIFITASEKDPCSNSLIEAIHCGLFPIALNDGGHTEIVKGNGVTYTDKNELLSIINLQLDKKSTLHSGHNLKGMSSIASEYLDFFTYLHTQKKKGDLKVSKLGWSGKFKIRLSMLRNKVYLRFGI